MFNRVGFDGCTNLGAKAGCNHRRLQARQKGVVVHVTGAEQDRVDIGSGLAIGEVCGARGWIKPDERGELLDVRRPVDVKGRDTPLGDEQRRCAHARNLSTDVKPRSGVAYYKDFLFFSGVGEEMSVIGSRREEGVGKGKGREKETASSLRTLFV